MKKITKEELRAILEDHAKWIKNKKEGVRADLREADLSGANLREANFTDAIIFENWQLTKRENLK